MREWLKDHVLEIASLVVAVVGVKGLTDFWARLREMFSSYSTEALFSCGLAAAAAAIVATYFARSGYRRRTAAKDAELANLSNHPTREEMDEAVENARREMSRRLEDAVRRAEEAEARVARDEDESAKRRAKAESEVIGCVRSMGFYARKVIYRIMTEGPQTIDDDWLSDIEGAYFFDRITFKTRLKNHKSKVDMKPGIKAFLMENPELFDEVREEVARELEERQGAESRVLETGRPMSTGGRPVGGAVPAGMMTAASGLAESLNRAMKQMDGASGTHDAEIAPLGGGEGRPTAAADEGSTDGEFSTITPAQARILRYLFESEDTHISTADGNVRSLLEKGIIHFVGRDTRTPLTGDQFEISDEWTKRINTHYDEFKRHCSLKL